MVNRHSWPKWPGEKWRHAVVVCTGEAQHGGKHLLLGDQGLVATSEWKCERTLKSRENLLQLRHSMAQNCLLRERVGGRFPGYSKSIRRLLWTEWFSSHWDKDKTISLAFPCHYQVMPFKPQKDSLEAFVVLKESISASTHYSKGQLQPAAGV